MVYGGYTGIPFADAVKRILNTGVEVAKRSELHTFAVIPKRWVVERSFAWLEKCRRLWKNGESLINTSLQKVVGIGIPDVVTETTVGIIFFRSDRSWPAEKWGENHAFKKS